jgi:hypothetical protein
MKDPSSFNVEGLSAIGGSQKPIVFAVGGQEGLHVRIIHKPIQPTALSDKNWVISSYEEIMFMKSLGKDDPLGPIKDKLRTHLVLLILSAKFPKKIFVENGRFVLSDKTDFLKQFQIAKAEAEDKWKKELPFHQRRKFEAAPPKRNAQ